MQFKLRRIILFTGDLDGMTSFYQNALGLKLVHSEKGWRDLDAGGCTIALHAGKPTPGTRPPKLAFYANDVEAARVALVERGVKMGKVLSTCSFAICDGRDSDGNRFQISSRA